MIIIMIIMVMMMITMITIIIMFRLQGAVEEGEGATLLTLTLLEATVKNCGFVVIIVIMILIIPISTIVITLLEATVKGSPLSSKSWYWSSPSASLALPPASSASSSPASTSWPSWPWHRADFLLLVCQKDFLVELLQLEMTTPSKERVFSHLIIIATFDHIMIIILHWWSMAIGLSNYQVDHAQNSNDAHGEEKYDQIYVSGSLPLAILGRRLLIVSWLWRSPWAGRHNKHHLIVISMVVIINVFIVNSASYWSKQVLSLGASGVVFPPVSEQEFLLHTRPRSSSSSSSLSSFLSPILTPRIRDSCSSCCVTKKMDNILSNS